MILDALHTTINPIVTAYPLVGDIDAETPFSFFRAIPTPLRTKDGIIGFEYLVEVGIVDRDPDTVDTLTETVKTAVLAMTGTIAGTEIEHVLFTDESGIYFLEPDQAYENDLEFKVSTKNR